MRLEAQFNGFIGWIWRIKISHRFTTCGEPAITCDSDQLRTCGIFGYCAKPGSFTTGFTREGSRSRGECYREYGMKKEVCGKEIMATQESEDTCSLMQ
jgi:hypothetical protein